MGRRRWATVLAVGLAGVVTAAGLVVLASAPKVSDFPVQPVVWGTCFPAEPAEPAGTPSAGDAEPDCAKVRVPVDWANPAGPTIDLALVRRHATNPQRKIGSLLINPGGPGISGKEKVLRSSGDFSKELQARFDLIGFDPRGVGESSPIRCDEDLLNKVMVSAIPRDEAAFTRLGTASAAVGASCRQHSGPVFADLDPTSVARDMDAIRTALGEEKISYYGTSYGTVLGQAYADLFPGHVRSIVLDSVTDPENTDLSRLLADASLAQEEGLAAFAAWCGRTPGCELHGREVLKVWDDLSAKDSRGELTQLSMYGHTAGLTAALRYYMMSPEDWGQAAGIFAELARSTSQEDAAKAAPGSGEDTTNEGSRLIDDGFYAISCQTLRVGAKTFAQFDHAVREAEKLAPHAGLNAIWKAVVPCWSWPTSPPPVHPQSPVFPQNPPSVRAQVPLLLVNSAIDVATPLAGARTVAHRIPSASFLTYDGVAHGAYSHSACVRDAVNTFLATPNPQRTESHCPAVWPKAEAGVAR